jgi:hypothetical protein
MTFKDVIAAHGKSPLHVDQEFADDFKCGRLEHGFMQM